MKKLLILGMLLLSGCASVGDIRSIGIDDSVDHICIQINPKVIVTDFDKILSNILVEDHGYDTEFYLGDRPSSCRYVIAYTAGRRWALVDIPMIYAKLWMYDGKSLLGTGVYGSRRRALPMGERWKSVREKLSPVVSSLLEGNR